MFSANRLDGLTANLKAFVVALLLHSYTDNIQQISWNYFFKFRRIRLVFTFIATQISGIRIQSG